MILAMMVGLPAATMAQQEQTGLRRVHLMTGAGTIPRNPAYRLEYLRYATTGEPRLTGTQMIERIPEVQKFARVTVESDDLSAAVFDSASAGAGCSGSVPPAAGGSSIQRTTLPSE